MNKKSAEWWIGQAIALYLGICAIGAWGGAAGVIVTYVLFVLIDIREHAKVCAGSTETKSLTAMTPSATKSAKDEGGRVD